MTQAIDKQILQYLPLLGEAEKESILGVIKSFISLHHENRDRASIEQYSKEMDEALARVNGGESFTQDEVEKMASGW